MNAVYCEFSGRKNNNFQMKYCNVFGDMGMLAFCFYDRINLVTYVFNLKDVSFLCYFKG